MPKTIDSEMALLGQRIVPVMKSVLHGRRYTGALEDSVEWNYNSSIKELSIGPNAKRGAFSAGMIAQEGSSPKKNVPWKKIRAWGEYRGLNLKQIRGAWMKIRDKGVSPHPFLNETLAAPGFGTALEQAAFAMSTKLAAQAISGDKTIGVATTT